MLPPLAERPPAGVPGVTLALMSLIGREYREAVEVASEYGYVPIRALVSGGPEDKRAFYGLHDVRLVLDFEGRVEETLVPRPLTDEESAFAAENIGLLHQILWELVYRKPQHSQYWEEILVQVLTDLYLMTFPVWDSTKGAISTFLYHRLRHNSKRVTQVASRRLNTERHVLGVGKAILHELNDIPVPEWSPPLIPDPSRAEALVRSLSPQDSERNVAIIVRRLGLCGPVPTLDVVAQEFGITRERVRQIVARFETRARENHSPLAALRDAVVP